MCSNVEYILRECYTETRIGIKDMRNHYMDENRLLNYLKNGKKHIAVLLGACMIGGTLSGCGFVSNPMQYMKEADEEQVASENASLDNTSGGNSSAGSSNGSSNPTPDSSSGNVTESGNASQTEVKDNKVIVIGTYGSISDMINAEDYKSQADIECIQETRDFDDTSDMLALVKQVQESCNTDAEAIIVSVRSRVSEQISYLLQHTINTSKNVIVISEDEENTDYKKVFAEALIKAVETDKNSNSGFNLHDIDIYDISGVNSLPYVNIVYDYIGNDAYAAEKVFNTSDAVVVVTESTNGSLSPAMSQLVKDASVSIPVVIVCRNGYSAVSSSQQEYNKCIITSGMTAEQARIMTMLCLTQSKNISDWRIHFTETSI